MAAQTLEVCMGRSVYWDLEDDEIEIRVPVQIAERWKQANSRLGATWYTRNIPMFLALVLAAFGKLNRRALLFLGIGLLAVLLLDGLVVAAHAWGTMQGVVPFNGAGHVLSVFGVWSLGGIFVAPLFIGAALALALMGHSGGGPLVRPGPNHPCPCGSGLKYKRCCGAR
jgi:hypothetical protein